MSGVCYMLDDGADVKFMNVLIASDTAAPNVKMPTSS